MPIRVRRSRVKIVSERTHRPARPVIVRRPGAFRRRSPFTVAPFFESATFDIRPDAFVDYSRVLTPEGGIIISYKDYDLRWRHTLWRVFAWGAATGFEGWLIHNYSPVLTNWLNAACLLLMAVINGLIVMKAVEIYRSLEVRADCMIVEGKDVFWLRKIEDNWPAFQDDKDHKDRRILCGIYGNRFVEYVTVHRFDECDRTPEVLAAHLHDAMTKLWSEGGLAPDAVGPSLPLPGPKQVY